MCEDKRDQLFTELEQIEKEGITLWLLGNPSNSSVITNTIFINEDVDYMRDYIYEKGVLKEVRFDKVSNL